MKVSKEEKHILQHSLGGNNVRPFYRNSFVTGSDTNNYPVCESLVEKGLMLKRTCPFLPGCVYHVTDEGKKVAFKEER